MRLSETVTKQQIDTLKEFVSDFWKDKTQEVGIFWKGHGEFEKYPTMFNFKFIVLIIQKFLKEVEEELK